MGKRKNMYSLWVFRGDKSKVNIVLDLDDVIFDFAGTFSKYLAPKLPDVPIEELRQILKDNHNFSKCKFDFVGHYNNFVEEGGFKNMPLTEPGVIEKFIDKALNKEDIINFATARFPNVQYDTLCAIDNLIGCCAFVLFSDAKVLPKWKIVQQLKGDFFVDNCYTYCAEVKEHNPNCYCVMYCIGGEEPSFEAVDGLHSGKIDAIAQDWEDIVRIYDEIR